MRALGTILLDGRFELVGNLGQGGAGTVFRVIDHARGVERALKMVGFVTGDPLLRFKREFRAVQSLEHPNIVTPEELFEDRGQWFYTMEIVDGVPFDEWVRPAGAGLDEARLRDALAQLALALGVLHDAGYVHRDVKPGNVLVTPRGRVVLLDLGLVVHGTHHEAALTQTQHTAGTVAFMAPEQAAGQPVSPAADWYAVGVMLYQALTGQLPFGGGLVSLVKRQTELPRAPSEVVPGVPADLDALCLALLATEPPQRAQRHELLSRCTVSADLLTGLHVTSASMDAFVGREEELALLDRAFDGVRLGRQVIVSVLGPSGLGKTALLDRFIERVQEADARAVLLVTRCREHEHVPYKALDGAVDQLSRWLKQNPDLALALRPEDVSVLADAFPVLDRVEAIRAARQRSRRVLDRPERRARILGALRELLARLSAQATVVLAIDDLQWTDEDSLVLLDALSSPPDPPPMLVLFVSRPRAEAGTRPSDRFERLLSRGESIHLAPLDDRASSRLAAELSGIRPELPAAWLGQITHDAKGYPFFIEMMVRFARAGNPVSDVSAAVAHTLDSLDPGCRRLVQAVCLAGFPIPIRTAAAAVGLEGNQVSPSLRVLRVLKLVRGSGPVPTDVVEPYHDRIRQEIAERLSPEEVRSFHDALARELALSDAPPDQQAHHLERAGRHEDARSALALAADRAMQSLAFDMAANFYRRAISSPGGRAEDRRTLQLRLGDALASSGRGAEAAVAFRAAVQGASRDEALDLERRAAEQLLTVGRVNEGIEAFRHLFKAVGIRYPETTLGALLMVVLRRLLVALRRRRYSLRATVETPRAILSRVDLLFAAAKGFGNSDVLRGQVFQGGALLLALSAGEPRRIARTLAYELPSVAIERADGDRDISDVVAGLRSAVAAAEDPVADGWFELGQGLARFVRGDWAEAESHTEIALTTFSERCEDVAWELSVAWRTVLFSRVELGRWSSLRETTEHVMRSAASRGDLLTQATVRFDHSAFEHLLSGRVAEARADAGRLEVEPGTWRFDIAQVSQWITLIRIELYEGRPDAAWSLLERWEPRVRLAQLHRIPYVAARLEAMRGLVALARAEQTPAIATPMRKAAIRSLRNLSRRTPRWARAHALVLDGALRLVEGDSRRAQATLVQAVEALEAQEVRGMANAVRFLLGARFEGADDEARRFATRWFAAQGAVDPARVTRMLLALEPR